MKTEGVTGLYRKEYQAKCWWAFVAGVEAIIIFIILAIGG